MAGHSAIDAEAEGNYAKDGLGAGLSPHLVALKVAKNLAFGSQEMLGRLAVFEWSYNVKGDHLATPEGDRFSKLIATERPLQRTILESVEREFVNDPSVRQKIVVSADNPSESSPDGQRRSYIYIYTRQGDEIIAQSIESFADAKALRALLKQLGCNDSIRAVEDGKSLIEPTSIRGDRGCLTLQHVSAATHLVTQTFSMAERSGDLAERLQWYVENREWAIRAREDDTQRRAYQLLEAGASNLVESTRAQAHDLNEAIVGGQALAQKLYREEHKDGTPPKEFVGVTRPDGITVVGMDARYSSGSQLDRISVLGWGNMARWAELLGLSIPNKQQGVRISAPTAATSVGFDGRGKSKQDESQLRGAMRSEMPERSITPDTRVSDGRGVRPPGLGGFRAQLGIFSAARSSSIDTAVSIRPASGAWSVTGLLHPHTIVSSPPFFGALGSQGFRAVHSPIAKQLLTMGGRVAASAERADGSKRVGVKSLQEKTETSGRLVQGVARLRMALTTGFFGRRGQRGRETGRVRGESRAPRGVDRILRTMRRMTPAVKSPARLASYALVAVRATRSRLAQAYVTIAPRFAALPRSVFERFKILNSRMVRSMNRREFRMRLRASHRQRDPRARRGVGVLLGRNLIARAISSRRAVTRGLRRAILGDTIYPRRSSLSVRGAVARLGARFGTISGLIPRRRGAGWAIESRFHQQESYRDIIMKAIFGASRPNTRGPLLERARHLSKGHRPKVVSPQDSRGPILVFVEWFLRQARMPRSRTWHVGLQPLADDAGTIQTTDIELGDEDAVMQESRAPEPQQSAESPDIDGAIDNQEHQETQADSAMPLMAAEPRWELSIFTARHFDSSFSDPESASPAA